jgi:hypothetical protein
MAGEASQLIITMAHSGGLDVLLRLNPCDLGGFANPESPPISVASVVLIEVGWMLYRLAHQQRPGPASAEVIVILSAVQP